MREAVVLGGHESREGPQDVAAAAKLLTQRGISIVESHVVKDRKQLVKRVRRAIKSGHKLIVVCAGDGGQTAVVGEFAHNDAVLGVIPGGTGNSFAQTLGIEPTLEAGVDAIVNGRIARVDLGRVNGRYFANFTTIGLTEIVAESTPQLLKKVAGPLAYAITAVKPLLTEKPFRATVRAGKKKFKLRTFQLVVANGRFFGDKPLLPNATITDGRLSFFTTKGLSHLDLLRMYAAIVKGTQTQLPDAKFFSAKRIRIETAKRKEVSIDGNFGGYTPATFRVKRKALCVMVPAAGTP